MAEVTYREPTLDDIGRLVEVCNDEPSDPKCRWFDARLASLETQQDRQYVCMPTHQVCIWSCEPWEIASWKHARIDSEEMKSCQTT